MILATKLEEKNIIWSTKPKSDEVFFDYKHKILMFLRDNMLEFLPFYPTDFSLPSMITIPDPNNKNKDYGASLEGVAIKSIGLSFSLKVMVISRRPYLLEFIDPLTTNLNRTTIFKLPAAGSLILFDWVRKSKTANFLLVCTAGIQILLIDENTLSSKKIVSQNCSIVNAWYDGMKQYLAVSFLESPNDLKIFDLNKVDEGISFKSPSYSVQLTPSMPLPTFNTNQYYERSKKTEESNATVVLDFINLYNENYLLHVDSEQGELNLHEIGGVGVKTVKILAESKFRYNIIDNLLVLHYLHEHITTVIDVRRDYHSITFGAPRSVAFKLEDIHVEDLAHFCKYLDQGHVDMYNERTKEDNLPKSLEDTFCRMPTDPDKESSINLDTNIVINTQKKTIFSLGLSLREVLTAVESQAERFCFLFRRNKSKECYVNYLRGLLFEKEELAVLRPIFIKIIDNYRTAKNEVKALRAKMKLALGGVTLESYKRLASGESFIKMKEFHDEVLQPIKDPFFLNSESQEYLLKSLLCFLYLALEKKLTIDIQTEDLVIRLLLKTRRFLVLHQMVQNSILEDRLMLALLLCELGTKVKRPVNEGKRWLTTDPVLSECIQDMDGYFYAPAFQVGIDMLHRLRINEKEEPTKLQMENFIFEYHVRNNRILECVEILETKKIKLSIQNLENLLVASNTPESNYSFKKLIVYFSMKQTRERILGSNEKFDEIVTKIIKQNEFMKALTQD